MKTNQILETTNRELLGVIVKQRTKDEYFNLDDIAKVIFAIKGGSGLKVIVDFNKLLKQKGMSDFVKALESEIGKPAIQKGGRNSWGWAHPYLMLKMLTHYSPEFEVKVYSWLWDYLVKYRVKGGDSYVEMCGVLYKYANQKQNFHSNIQKLAKIIKDICGVYDWNRATIEQLEKRELVHKMIIQFTEAFKSTNQGVRTALSAFDAKQIQG